MKSKRISIFLCLMLVATVFAVMPMSTGAEEEPPEEPPMPPGEPPEEPTEESPEEPTEPIEEDQGWRIDDNGTYFEITKSEYLNITFTSSENIHLYLESIPRMIDYHIERNCSADSTDITISGFEVNMTYYRYQEGDLQEEFTTDESGNYSYTQDISTPHHVFIQEMKATIYIRSDGSIDPSTAPIDRDGDTYTLTDNIYESIFIQKSGITLDGAGYTVDGPRTGYGIYLSNIYSATIIYFQIKEFSRGIYLSSSDGNTVRQSLVSGNYLGIYMSSSDGNTITVVTVESNREGIDLVYSDSNTVSGNTIRHHGYSIYMSRSNGNTISENTVSGNRWTSYTGISLGGSFNTIIGNSVSTHNSGIGLGGSFNTIIGNTVSGNYDIGIRLSYADSNIVSGNKALGSPTGISLGRSAGSNTVNENTVSGNSVGILMSSSAGSNIISGNTVSGNGNGILLYRSAGCDILMDNVMTSNTYNFEVSGYYLTNYIQEIHTSNTVDGKPIYYLVDRHYETVPSDAGYVGVVGSDHITVDGCTVTNNAQGVLFAYTSDSTIRNVVVSNNQNGIHLHRSKGNAISGNTASNNHNNGIFLYISSGNAISGNTVLDNYEYGIEIYESSSNTISGNTASDNYWSGVKLGPRCRLNTVSENTISNNGLGIDLWGFSNNNTLSGNTIYSVYENIRLTQSTDNTISENTLTGSYWGIHLGSNSNSNTIRNNVVNNAYLGIFSSMESKGNIISRNTLSGNVQGIKLRSSSNNVINRNTFSDNTWDIRLEHDYWGGSIDNIIFHNNINNYVSDANPTNNAWHHPVLLEGNYWSNYAGLDDGSGIEKHAIAGDGIGDTEIPHPGQDFDFYPFIQTNGWPDRPPVADTGGPYVSDEGFPINFDASASTDPDGDPLQYRWDFNNDGSYDTGWSLSPYAYYTWYDDHTGTATVQVTDGEFIVEETTTVSVINALPEVSITGPAVGSVYPVNTPITFTGAFTDAGTEDTHSAYWTLDSIEISGIVTESDGSGTVTGSYTFTSAGVYKVKLTVIDDDGGEGTSEMIGDLTAMVVVYDPEGGFVTGGGWIDSPEGAFIPDPTLTGKASFGFVAKYKKGATTPIGNTEFQFKAGDLNFHSDTYDWLVIAGARAIFKGSGTINGQGDYKFKLWAVDGEIPGGGGVDKFRIKIWEEDSEGTEYIIYDNGAETELGGGQIVIHTKGK